MTGKNHDSILQVRELCFLLFCAFLAILCRLACFVWYLYVSSYFFSTCVALPLLSSSYFFGGMQQSGT